MQLTANKRTKLGKKTKNLRKQRILPAVVFGVGIDSVPISVPMTDFERVYREAGETNLVDLDLDGDSFKILIQEVQKHPVDNSLLHVNLFKVKLDQKITANIPVEITGDQENELVKSGEALVLQIINEIEIEALPTDLPDAFTVDVTALAEIGDGITVDQLNYDKSKVELVGVETDDLVVKLDYAVTEEEEEEELTEEEMLEQLDVTGEADDKDAEEDEEPDQSASKDSE